ncbi:MAG TPA: hypothetical protein VML95_02035 [Longimicrobiales bacterium]|nr:hypothetical protein [Longimicrobiales bacterium]
MENTNGTTYTGPRSLEELEGLVDEMIQEGRRRGYPDALKHTRGIAEEKGVAPPETLEEAFERMPALAAEEVAVWTAFQTLRVWRELFPTSVTNPGAALEAST